MVRTIVRFVAVVLGLTLTAGPSLADGKVFARYAAVPPAMPDQQAIIAFDAAAGVQTMAVESRFVPAATGTEHAWVVPLPGPEAPIITQATPGLFPTTRAAFLPRVTGAGSGAGSLFGIVIVASLLALLAARVFDEAPARFLIGAAIVVVLVGCLLPALGSARAVRPRGDGVVELARESLGAHDVTVIAAGEDVDSGARLRAWLIGHGFEVSASLQPILAHYASRGWVFAACRLDPSRAADPVAAAPLVFKFRTPRPVYPMRLTGVGNVALDVDLFVFADGRAAAPGFEAVRCSALVPDNGGRDPSGRRAVVRADDQWPVVVGHEGLLAIGAGRTVATHLRATLSPAQQQDDVPIQLGPFVPVGGVKYTWRGAMERALDIAAPVSLAVLLLVLVLAAVRGRDAGWMLKRSGPVLAFGAVLWGGLVLATPTTTQAKRVDRRAEAMRSRAMDDLPDLIRASLRRDPTITTPEVALATARRAAESEWRESFDPDVGEERPSVREEDSHGNYTLRLIEGRVEFVTYSSSGAAAPGIVVWR